MPQHSIHFADNDWAGLKRTIRKLAHNVLGPDASPEFTGLTLSGLTATRLVSTDADKLLASTDIVNWVAGTTNQVTVTDDSDGTITLSLPQDIHTGASPVFTGLTITGSSACGLNSVVFQPTTDSTTFFQVLDADGGAPILNIDSTNERVGIGTVSPPETLLELTSTVPYITLHNSTHEDSDGGRESRMSFKGEQSGGEETTLARIEAGHDGVGNDEKGYWDLFINDGNDNNSPTKRIRIDSLGIEVIGRVSSATLTITASADDTDVSDVNILFINAATPATPVVIGGLKGGVDGQVLYVSIIDHTSDVTLEHAEGIAGSQDLIMHDSSDETLDNYGGWILICNGTNWYDASHARHV